MKHIFTAMLAAFVLLAPLAGCTPAATEPSAPPVPSASPSTEPVEQDEKLPEAPDGAGTQSAFFPSAEPSAAPNTAPDPSAENESAILAAWPDIDPDSFFWMGDHFLVRDSAGVEYVAHLLSESQQTAHAAEYPGAEVPLFAVDAFTDENGEWRSGENGAGVDAEAAEHILGFFRPYDDPDEHGGETLGYVVPITGMTPDPDSGVVLATIADNTVLVYITAAAPDAEAHELPVQLFYSCELPGVGSHDGTVNGRSIELLAYNEGYGWSTLDG